MSTVYRTVLPSQADKKNVMTVTETQTTNGLT